MIGRADQLAHMRAQARLRRAPKAAAERAGCKRDHAGKIGFRDKLGSSECECHKAFAVIGSPQMHRVASLVRHRVTPELQQHSGLNVLRQSVWC